ncbi:MAG: diacylglycerol kinase family protein [Candidatus Rokuibacteriota bacterium]
MGAHSTPIAPRAFFVINPVSGGGKTSRLWPAVKDRFAHHGFEFATTSKRGDGVEIARRAALDGWPLVVAVGGDGTVNEVVNGLLEAGAPVTLGILNAGRGNDCRRNFDLPARLPLALDRLLAGRDVPIDVGLAEWPDGRRRHFVMSLGAGFDAAVAARAERSRGSGKAPYVRALLGTLRTYRPLPATIRVDERVHFSGPITAAVVANGPYYGQGMKIAPTADPHDGVLDLVVLGNLGRVELLRWLPTVYRGRHLANPKVSTARGRTIAIDAPAPLPLHVDGEPCGETPVRVSILPAALRLRV